MALPEPSTATILMRLCPSKWNSAMTDSNPCRTEEQQLSSLCYTRKSASDLSLRGQQGNGAL